MTLVGLYKGYNCYEITKEEWLNGKIDDSSNVYLIKDKVIFQNRIVGEYDKRSIKACVKPYNVYYLSEDADLSEYEILDDKHIIKLSEKNRVELESGKKADAFEKLI